MNPPELDPTNATSERLNRRSFVGIAGGAALAAAAPAPAHETFGKPHPPLVSEDDSAIGVEHVELKLTDAPVAAYAAWPAHGGPQTPSVVVIMHLWGVDAQIRDVVRRYAKAGFAAIAPDLYSRLHAPDGDGVSDYSILKPYAQKLDRRQWLGDVRAAVEWLAEKFPGTKTGLTGFCMGGKLVLIALSEEGNLFAAAAPFYGAVADIDPKAIHTPACGSYGARDTGIPAVDVRAFAAALAVPNDFKIYDDAGHAFFDDTRPSYVASAAQDAWARTIAFFTKYLGAPAT
ncbi:MAG TPA: dienelactone hydrolase family protein [Candidatus Nitrosotalea sp.]|nr:dienelactone hydrolase family protein [Candidatus Nitrosotalea sp.]